jgi:hypothetical protein
MDLQLHHAHFAAIGYKIEFLLHNIVTYALLLFYLGKI